MKLNLHLDGERKNCQNAQQQFQLEVRSYNKKMEERMKLYDDRLRLIDLYQREQDQYKADYRKFRDETIANIQNMKKELLEQRSVLLISKDNHAKGQQIGQVIQADIEDKMEEFSSMTDTLRLTKMSLREVETALNRVHYNLKKFEVTLKDFKSGLGANIDRFRAIKHQLDKCDMSNPSQLCKELENDFLSKTYLGRIQDEILAAGMGGIVLGRMYNTLYGLLTNLKEYPVGLYDEDLTVKQNVKNFKKFVKNMNKQEDYHGQTNDKLKHIGVEIDNINSMRAEKGLGQFNVQTITAIKADMNLS